MIIKSTNTAILIEEIIWEKDLESTRLINELLDNGLAEKNNNTIFINHDQIVELDEIEQSQLELPERYPFTIIIKSSGTLNEKTFKFNWHFTKHEFGDQLVFQRVGCLLLFNNQPIYVLCKEDYKICEALDEFNSLPDSAKSFTKNLLSFSNIKELSMESAALLDQYLMNENVFKADKIELDVKVERNKVIVSPHITGEQDINNKFLNKFNRERTSKNIYNIQQESERTRIVIDDAKKEEIQKIKEINKLEQNKIIEIINNPTEYFDPDNIDLEEFSKRVKEIGHYTTKFYPFITPYKSEWLPGITIELGPEDKRRIIVKDENEYKDLKEAISGATQKGETHVNFKGISIPIHLAKELSERFKNRKKKPKLTSPQEQSNVVLIPFENIESLEYGENIERTGPAFTEVEFYPPPTLRSGFKLLKHQQEGIAWLQSLYLYAHEKNISSGALLADDMGLGKTLQVLSFIDWHYKYHNIQNRSYLIIAPVSLLENWKNEVSKFFNNPELETVILTSNVIISKIQNYTSGTIILTNYETLRNSKAQMVLGRINWATLITDEAQRIKTPGTLTTNAAKTLKADFKIAITGTPVENTLVDIWCIMDFLIPGLLGGGKEFAKKYQNPLSKKETNIQELGEALRKEIGFFLTRRLKSDALKDLPEIEYTYIETTMSEDQLNTYKAILAEHSDSDEKGRILQTIYKLRVVSDHPYILTRDLSKVDPNDLFESSAKLKSTIELLETIKEKNEKVLIFAELKDVQRILQKVIKDKFGITAKIINGETPPSVKNLNSSKLSRQNIIDEFSAVHGFGILILSPVATGVGLNITAANNVIHYSRHWNPAKENQATDRTHRIGQTKKVNVYYPICVADDFETFDIVLAKLLDRKKKLFRASLFPSEMIEVKPADIFGGLGLDGGGKGKPEYISEKLMDQIKPSLFEALVGKVYENNGYKIILTPVSGDRGADVICFKDNGNYIIQVKQSANNIGLSAVNEITAAKGYYEKVYQQKFTCCVATNSFLTKPAIELAEANNVEVKERRFLLNQILKNKITTKELRQLELTSRN